MRDDRLKYWSMTWFVVLLLVFSCILAGWPSESRADVSGVWSGLVTINIPDVLISEDESFIDVFYQDGNYLYLPGYILCPGYQEPVALSWMGENTFTLPSPILCSETYGMETFSLTIEQFDVTFSGESSFAAVRSGTATYSGHPAPVSFNGSVLGGRVDASTQLMNNVPVTGLSGAEGSYRAFYIDVPVSATDITVTTSGGSGDSDLYLIYSKPPFWWDQSFERYNEESVDTVSPDAGMWYIIVEGYLAYSDVTILYSVNTSLSAALPVPTGNDSIQYLAGAFPELYNNPMQAKPIGIGPLASGGDTLNVKIGLNPTAEAVDIYIAYRMHSNPLTVYVLGDGGFTPLSVTDVLSAMETGMPLTGFEPWIRDTMDPVNINLVSVSVASLTSGRYDTFVLMTPAGVMNVHYLWMSSFRIPD